MEKAVIVILQPETSYLGKRKSHGNAITLSLYMNGGTYSVGGLARDVMSSTGSKRHMKHR